MGRWYFAAVGADVGEAQIIDQHDDDVRPIIRDGRSPRRAEAPDEEKRAKPSLILSSEHLVESRRGRLATRVEKREPVRCRRVGRTSGSIEPGQLFGVVGPDDGGVDRLASRLQDSDGGGRWREFDCPRPSLDKRGRPTAIPRGISPFQCSRWRPLAHCLRIPARQRRDERVGSADRGSAGSSRGELGHHERLAVLAPRQRIGGVGEVADEAALLGVEVTQGPRVAGVASRSTPFSRRYSRQRSKASAISALPEIAARMASGDGLLSRAGGTRSPCGSRPSSDVPRGPRPPGRRLPAADGGEEGGEVGQFQRLGAVARRPRSWIFFP